MADPLSITAGVIAVIQIADKVISVCKGYITAVKDAPRDLRTIMIEVGSVRIVLEVLESLISGESHADTSVILGKLKSSGEPLEGCKQALTALDSLFPAVECKLSDSKRRKTSLSLVNLAWPFKESKARRLLEDIGRHKATISLALTTELVHDIKTIKSGVQRLDDALNDEQYERILKWLVAVDPSSNHAVACDLHESHTGKWLIRSPDYEHWVNGSTSFLWLHGIPGSGKTVLASFVIEEVKRFCKISTGGAWAYYYFYFKREKDEAPQFLRWVINQLCRRSKHIPAEVRKLYSDGCEPTTASLFLALAAVIKGFQHVYLVLDALDESSNRASLLDALIKISGDDSFRKIRILATSRKELDIERALENVSTDISLQNSWVDEDIHLYIQNHLREDRRLNRWPESLRVEIEAALTKGAKGMFRWAFCQLDILGRLKSATDIRRALCQLPETLDETYERILTSIPTENVKFARRALHLLAFDFGIHTLDELAEAVIVDDTNCTYTPHDRFLDPTDILEICTCLITYNKDVWGFGGSEVRLAHYSVKEYLTSERMKATAFKTSEIAANVLAAKVFIAYFLGSDYQAPEKVEKNGSYPAEHPHHQENVEWVAIQNFPLYRTATRFNEFVNRSGNDEVVIDLVLKLLNTSLPHFGAWLELYALLCDSDSEIPKWKVPQGAELTATLAYLCWFDILPAAGVLLERYSNSLDLMAQLELDGYIPWTSVLGEGVEGTLLHVAATLGRESFVEFLISKGADTNAISSRGSTVLESALAPMTRYETCQRIIDLLLAANSNPNPPRVATTPLQAAIIHWGYPRSADAAEIVRVLLDAGANINATGDDTAVTAQIRYNIQRRFGDQEDVMNEDIGNRGERYNYQTPLRILEENHSTLDGTHEKRFNAVKQLLIKHGAKSLHLPPDGVHSNTEAHLKIPMSLDLVRRFSEIT